MNTTTILGSNVIFTNRNTGDVVLQAGPSETLLLKNTVMDSPYISCVGTVGSFSLSNNVNTKITGVYIPPTIYANSSDITWDSVNGEFTLNRIGGTYFVESFLGFAANATGSRESSFVVNGVSKNTMRVAAAGVSAATQIVNTIIIPSITSATTVSLWGLQDSGGSLGLGATWIFFNCYRIS